MADLMQALIIDRFGGPEVLHIGEIPRPIPGPGEVLVEVAYASVNPADWKTREGMLSKYIDYKFPFVLGFDLAGVVRDVVVQGSRNGGPGTASSVHPNRDKDRTAPMPSLRSPMPPCWPVYPRMSRWRKQRAFLRRGSLPMAG